MDGFPQRKHLRRLGQVFETGRSPLYLVTVCVRGRRQVLNQPAAFEVIVSTLREALRLYGWMVGRFVVMPDHVHLFATPAAESAKDLPGFVGAFKRWTSRRIGELGSERFAWQREFFDHLMRSRESYSEKWEYVRANPVRAGLVEGPDEWPYQGEIHALSW